MTPTHNDAYTLSFPDVQTTSVVFASPHSGRHYPRAFLRRSVLDELTIRSSEDAFIDLIVGNAPDCGAPLLVAKAPRAFLDLNRASDELDPSVVEGIGKVAHNPRIASGLGVVPRVVSNGRAIYRGKISKAEATARIERYWLPYHTCLQKLLDHTRRQFNEAILIDCHSMPHEALDAVAKPGAPRPEVVLGDRFGSSAETDLVDRIETIFLDAGLTVSRNAPFAGAYITQHYGRPSRRQHAIQIEVDRALYLNETYVRPNDNFRNFQAVMTRVVQEISDIGRASVPLAAE
ncbi:N-formylglutamate amidohydrolase [Litoreibacter roseus]|nr:N-formylglutamate amidohydrolase [Litoreibacter roseus]